jgi:hypothetical protein
VWHFSGSPPPKSFSPTPSPLPGGFASNDPQLKPLGGSHLVIVALSGEHSGQVVARLLSGADGLFAAQLPPGRYEVRAHLPHQPLAGKVAFAVTPGTFTRVEVLGGIFY